MLSKLRSSAQLPPFLAALALALLSLVAVACVRRVQPLADDAFIPADVGQQAGSASPTVAPLPVGTSPVEPVLTPTPTLFQDEPTLPRSQYALVVRLDYPNHRLEVSQALNFINRSTDALPELLLVVEPNRQPGIFELKSIRWGDERSVQVFSLEAAQLRVPLPEPLPPGKALRLSLDYELNLPERAEPLGFTARQTNLSYWYPFVPPYLPGQGWVVHDPSPVAPAEHLNYPVADFEVAIQILAAPEGSSIAASAPAAIDGPWHRYQVEAARNFTWSVSPDYQMRSEQVGDTTVMSYFFPEHQDAGEAALQASASALSLFADLYGPYLHQSLTVVEADLPDGLEFDGMFFLSQEYYETYFGGPQNFLTTLSAHETAHQWWYGLVGNNQALEPWLDEALATYSEALFFEEYHPGLLDWWWSFRVGLYEPDGWVDSTIYDHADFQRYVNAVYLRGALFLRDLRELAGDEAFFATLRDFIGRYSYRLGDGQDFFRMLADHSANDSAALLQEYFSPE